MSNTILSSDIKNVKCYQVSYPEIRKFSVDGKINTQAVKCFLHEYGYINGMQLVDPNLDYQTIAYGLFRAFRDGVLSLNATKQTGVKGHCIIRISTTLGGKMRNVWAFSTLSLVNPLCLIRMQNGKLVCANCYVKKSLHICAVLNYVQNSFVLMNYQLADSDIPVINPKNANKHPYIRLESFGDIYNTLQAENYFRIVRKNPVFSFALWSKNPNWIKQAVDSMGKPENLSTVLSVSKVGMMSFDTSKWHGYFDHTFRVVETQTEKDHILSHNSMAYPCHCGPESCLKCHACYDKSTDISEAVELLRK